MWLVVELLLLASVASAAGVSLSGCHTILGNKLHHPGQVYRHIIHTEPEPGLESSANERID